MKYWINDHDNRLFITKLGFVIVALFLLFFLHHINDTGQYSELIIGIVGLFIGVASTSATALISGKKETEITQLREEIDLWKSRVNKIELQLTECIKEKDVYKNMFDKINSKLVEQSGILNSLKNNN